MPAPILLRGDQGIRSRPLLATIGNTVSEGSAARCSLHTEYTSDKPNLTFFETASRIPGLLCEIVDEYRQAQLPHCSGRGVCGSPAQMSVAGIFEEFGDESALVENRAHFFARDKEAVGRAVAHGRGK